MRSSAVIRWVVALLVASMVLGCRAPEEELSEQELVAARWLGRAYSEGSISAQDLFFEAFWMTDATFANDREAWACLFESVVAELSHPDTEATLADLMALTAADPDHPVEHRQEIEKTLATLPEDVRVRIGEAVVAGDGQCGDVRLGMFGGGGPTPVCIWDRTTRDQRAKLVAESIGAVYPDQYEWSSDVQAIVESCYAELSDAYDSGETLEWVEDLEAEWGEYYWNLTANTPSSVP